MLNPILKNNYERRYDFMIKIREGNRLEKMKNYNVMDCANFGLCCLSGACCNVAPTIVSG